MKRSRRAAKVKGSSGQSDSHAVREMPLPFKPQRRLFMVLLITFFLWLALLLGMYFST